MAMLTLFVLPNHINHLMTLSCGVTHNKRISL